MAVWLLPGQGAQAPGMGADILDDAAAREVFAAGSDVLGCDLCYLALEAGKDEVDEAFNAQVLTAAVSIACGRALMARGVEPSAFVGFSLGQISALALSGMLSLDDTFELLGVRARAMARACREQRGAMLALARVALEEAEELAREAAQDEVLVVANHNSPAQKVVSGTLDAVARCEDLAQARGIRCVRLNTAGAFHSPLMHSAAAEVRKAAARLEFREPAAPVICNTDALPLRADAAAEQLALQVESPVLFEESVAAVLACGEAAFLEVGFGKVLSGLVRRIAPGTPCGHAGTLREVEEAADTEKEVLR